MPANLPYPMQFDPSQWKNPYTKWAGMAMPFYGAGPSPAGLFGGTAPTDAMGNPIQSYTDANATAQADYAAQQAAYQKALGAYNAGQSQTPGTTINNTGQGQGQDNGLTALNDMRNNIVAQNLSIQGDPAMRNQGGFGSGNNVLSNTASMQTRDNAIALDQLNRQITAAGQSTAPARPAPPTAPQQPNMTQAYLAALQSPGHVTSPGATVAQGPPPSQQSNVLQQFLASNRGGTGAGNYDNRGFFSGLVGNV